VITPQMLLEISRDLSVLYVEDDDMLRSSTAELFSVYFKKIDTAVDGVNALEMYEEFKCVNDVYYDLVITDLNMPRMNGIEMCNKMLTFNETQAIIITTAHNSADYLLESIALGINGFITKPIDKNQLNRAIFKAAQAINDHKMIDIYIDQVEELNAELQEKNDALVAKNLELEKSFRMLDTVIHKEEIINPITSATCVTKEDIAKEEDIKEQIYQLIHDDLFELREVLTEIDVSIIDIINNIDNLNSSIIEPLAKQFSRYASILKFYTFFTNLSAAMSNFSLTMQNTPLPESEENIRNIFMFLETFVYVLSKWQDDLASGEESKLNQFDASIISDMDTITNMWTQKHNEEVSEDDLDDIFDF